MSSFVTKNNNIFFCIQIFKIELSKNDYAWHKIATYAYGGVIIWLFIF